MPGARKQRRDRPVLGCRARLPRLHENKSLDRRASRVRVEAHHAGLQELAGTQRQESEQLMPGARKQRRDRPVLGCRARLPRLHENKSRDRRASRVREARGPGDRS